MWLTNLVSPMHTSRSMRLLSRCSAGEDCRYSRYFTCSAVAAASAIISRKGNAKLAIISLANGYFCGFSNATGPFHFGQLAVTVHLGISGLERPRKRKRLVRGLAVFTIWTRLLIFGLFAGCKKESPQHAFLQFTLEHANISLWYALFHYFDDYFDFSLGFLWILWQIHDGWRNVNQWKSFGKLGNPPRAAFSPPATWSFPYQLFVVGVLVSIAIPTSPLRSTICLSFQPQPWRSCNVYCQLVTTISGDVDTPFAAFSVFWNCKRGPHREKKLRT